MPGRVGSSWLCVVGLGLGAWLGGANRSYLPGWEVALAVAGISGALAATRRAPVTVAIAATVSSIALGFAAGGIRSEEGAELERAVQRTRGCSFEARVLEQAGGLGTLAALEAASCSSGPLPAGNVFLDATPPPPAGARVHGWGWVTSLGRDDFAAARRRAGGRALLVPVTLELQPPHGLWAGVAQVRTRFRAVAAERLPEREAALLLGLTIGDTTGFSEHDLDSFRASGLAHLLAVSGSNVAIVLGAVAAATRRLAYVRRLALTFCAVSAYVAIVGPDGSVLRAAVMGTVAVLAGGWIRPVDPVHSLPFALLLLIAVRPSIASSAGLHLSAAATLGIVLWSHDLTHRLRILPGPIAASLGVTIAAQVGVAPLLVLLFERLSLIAPVTNVLAAPAVGAATLVGMAAALVGPLAPGAASIVSAAAGPPLRWILYVADTGASGPWAEASVPRWGGWVLAAGVLACVWRTLRRTTPA